MIRISILFYLLYITNVVIGLFLQVNALDGLGQTALHRVAQQGNMQACRLLMSYGVDSSIVSLQGYTAAQLATENIQKMLKGKLNKTCNECTMLVEIMVQELWNKHK